MVYVLVSVLCVLVYVLFFRHYVVAHYAGDAPAWFAYLVDKLQPRFSVEKHRFPVDFFLEKADQLIFRALLVIFLSGVLFHSLNKSVWQKFWAKETDASPIQRASLRILLYLGVIYFSRWLHEDLLEILIIKEFYQPISFYALFNLPYPNELAIHLMFALTLIGAFCAIFNFYPALMGAVVAFLFFVMQGYTLCFENINHRDVTLMYALLLFPIWLRSQEYSWVLKLIRACICVFYLMSGLEKSFTSHFTWFFSDTLLSYLYFFGKPAGLWLASHRGLVYLMSSLVLVLQLGFPIILFFRKLTFFFVLGAIAFHIGTAVVLGVGGFYHPWIFVHIFFISSSFFERFYASLPDILKKNTRRLFH